LRYSHQLDEAKRKYTEFVEPLMIYENSTSQEETAPQREEYSSSKKVLLEDAELSTSDSSELSTTPF
ncbi:hypothetical protein T10_8752, partial [Trichinella papuae]